MADELSQEQKDWRDRFRAVSQAQGQYLYALLIVGLFFASLAEANGWSLQTRAEMQDLSLLGIKVNSHTLLAAGPLVLSFLLLAALGTFPAVKFAHIQASKGLEGERLFERLDSVPNALDFAIYDGLSKDRKWKLGLLIYPACLWLVCIEAIAIAIRTACAHATLTITQQILTLVGFVFMLFVVPSLCSLTSSKLRQAFGISNDNGNIPA